MYKYFIVVYLAFLILPSLQAQEDIKGSEDHPLLTRYPGSYIASYEVEKFREYSFATGPVTGYRFIDEKKTIGGQIYRISYMLEKSVDEVSITEVYEDYLQAIKNAGLTVLANGVFPQRNVGKTVGGMSWTGVAMIPNSLPGKSAGNYLFTGTSTSGGTFAIMAQIARPEGITYLAIYSKRRSNNQVICHVDIIEEKSAETGNVTVDADYLSRQIDQLGKVAIYGIYFDFDKASLKPESKPALDEIAKLLKSRPNLNLYVVGHTDMKGTFAYNLKLSRDRAQSVVDALLQDYGISSDRLEPQGVGPLVPILTNKDDDGRAQNRRVELVER